MGPCFGFQFRSSLFFNLAYFPGNSKRAVRGIVNISVNCATLLLCFWTFDVDLGAQPFLGNSRRTLCRIMNVCIYCAILLYWFLEARRYLVSPTNTLPQLRICKLRLRQLQHLEHKFYNCLGFPQALQNLIWLINTSPATEKQFYNFWVWPKPCNILTWQINTSPLPEKQLTSLQSSCTRPVMTDAHPRDVMSLCCFHRWVVPYLMNVHHHHMPINEATRQPKILHPRLVSLINVCNNHDRIPSSGILRELRTDLAATVPAPEVCLPAML